MLFFYIYAEDENLSVIFNAEHLKIVKSKKVIWKKDGARMVFIPTNTSGTGSKEVYAVYNEFGDIIIPKKEVVIGATDAFYMDIHEVTIGQFKKFLESSDYTPTETISWEKNTKCFLLMIILRFM